MKKILSGILLIFMSSALSHAQNVKVPAGYELVDSLVYVQNSDYDRSLSGKSIFNIMPSRKNGDAADVLLHQSQAISAAMYSHINANESRSFSGFRVRIFFDNKQNSRGSSEGALESFQSRHRDVAAYRSYVNPYFKVTVGDFRTKSEAMKFLQSIKGEFPSAIVVKENINYPVVDRMNAVMVDTVKVLRRKNR